MTTAPPPGGPTLGWVPCRWTPAQGEKQQCVACNRKVWHGICHHNDKSRPPMRVMCDSCYRAIMATPTAPLGTPGFDPPESEGDAAAAEIDHQIAEMNGIDTGTMGWEDGVEY